ncbi:MAG: SdrD B-like domain-containing protein [Lewinella sp.]
MRHYLLSLLLLLFSSLSAQCLVEAGLLSTSCLPDIERYTAEFEVRGVTPGTSGVFEVTDIDGNSFGSGEYPGVFTASSFLIGQDILLLFADTSTTGCHDTIQLVSPDCPVVECDLIVSPISTVCDTSQNAYLINFVVDNIRINPNSGWLAFNEQGDILGEGPYGIDATFGPFDAGRTTLVLFQDIEDPNCTFTVEAEAPDCFVNSCEIDVEFLENECTPDGTGVFFRFTVSSTEDAAWTAPQFGGMGGQTNTGQIFRAGPYGPDRAGRVTFRLTELTSCSITRDIPAATCPEFPCFGFAVTAEPAEVTFCESGEVWDFTPINGTYPMSIELFNFAGDRFLIDSLFEPGVYSDFTDQGEYRVVLTDANGCTAEQEISVTAHFCSSLQGFSWLDENRNGIREPNEIGVMAEVRAINLNRNTSEVTITNQNGFYVFSNLLEGTYQLQFSPIGQELRATARNVGDDECVDSNIDLNTWTTEPIQIAGGGQFNCFDAGWLESDCELLFLIAFQDDAGNSCGEIPNIIVDHFSPSYPVIITLIGPDGSSFTQTLDFEETITFPAEITGTYLVTIDTPEGCLEATQVDVGVIEGLAVTIEQTGTVCNDNDPSFLTATVPNIDPVSLTYEWSTGATTSSITDLTINTTYVVTVTNQDDGCFGIARYVTSQNDSFNFITFNEPFVIDCDSDSVFVSVDSVLEGYEYRWFGPLNQIFEGPGFWAEMAGNYYLEAFSETGCSLIGEAEVLSGSLRGIVPTLVVFPNDSICASHNCIRLFFEGPFFGNVPPGVEVLWETPNPISDSLANANPFGTLCTFYPGLHRVTITTECDTIVRSVVLDDPRGCSSISGQLWVDQGGDCGLDPEDTPVPNYILMLTNDDTGEMYYVMTDANGNWQLEVPEGTYTVAPSLAPGSPFGTCDPAVSVTLGSSPVTGVTVLLPAIASCPLLTTSASMPFLRRCFNNVAWVEYENRGSATAPDAEVTITLDDFFLDANFTPTPISQDGQTYTFAVGDLEPFERGLIYIQFRLSCEADLGQNHCLEASISPDAPCDPDPAWDGALVDVDALGCDGDSVLFRITNIGEGQMSVPLSYVIVEDGIMLFGAPQVNGQLDPNEVMDILLPANGSTYHVMTNQEPNAPAEPVPTAVVAGCNASGNGTFSSGFANILNLADGPLTTTTVCRENQGAYDPNDKRGFPLGHGTANFIPEGTRLDYAIRFQNTGTDTAFTVIIRDTIPESLDLATIKMDASSHPYTVSLDTHRVLSFVFENILLPDSSTNLVGSQGVVNFSIDHAADLQPGDKILNEAAIYFDFNEPIITNLSRHTIDKDGLPTGTRNQLAQQVAVGIFPNPSTGLINVRIPDQRIQPSDLLLITDLYGRQLAKANYATAANGWNVGHLPAGYYLVVVTDNQGRAMGRAGFVKTN